MVKNVKQRDRLSSFTEEEMYALEPANSLEFGDILLHFPIPDNEDDPLIPYMYVVVREVEKEGTVMLMSDYDSQIVEKTLCADEWFFYSKAPIMPYHGQCTPEQLDQTFTIKPEED